jgi:rubrerythrin
MVTLVGMQLEFSSAVKELLELEFDALEAYNYSIDHLEQPTYRTKLKEFRKDHERHIQELTALLKKHGEEAPTGPSMIKQWLAKGKAFMGNLIGDRAILIAMSSNEIDTNTAYERLLNHSKKWADSNDILTQGLADERRHKKEIDALLDQSSDISL